MIKTIYSSLVCIKKPQTYINSFLAARSYIVAVKGYCCSIM